MAKRLSVTNLPFAAKLVVGFALCGLVALAYFLIFFSDLSKEIDQEQQRERSLRQQLAEARRLEFEYQKDLADLTERQQRQSELKKILPAAAEYPSFLSAVQSVANVSGVTLTAWRPQPEVAKEFYVTVPMELQLTGRFHQVAKFFYGVGQLPRIINMEDISIKNPRVVGSDVTVDVRVLATAFRELNAATDTASGPKKRARK